MLAILGGVLQQKERDCRHGSGDIADVPFTTLPDGTEVRRFLARIVTFANGTVARELLVDCDHARRRLVYAAISERIRQHSAAVQVIADDNRRCRLIWTVDVLPHEIATYIDVQMDQASLAMQRAFTPDGAAKSPA